MLTSDDIDAVVFDMGGVFMIPGPEPMAEILAEAGIAVEMTGELAHLGHYTGIRAISELVRERRLLESDPDMWVAYDRAYFEAVGVADHLQAAARDARTAVRNSPDRPPVHRMWSHVLDHNRAALRDIANHRPVAIVSNNDGTAAQQCLDMGICQVGPGPLVEVAALVDSGVLGIAKPDPRIFSPALAALATDPARTLYVGDTVHADVHGATAAGMPVVQLDPYDLHHDHDHWRLPDLVALAALFG